MMKAINNKTRSNIARIMGVDSYETLLNADEEKTAEIIAAARKKRRYKTKVRAQRFPASGNPYVMLGKIMDREGKLVK